jgi:hypothetical protein
MPPHLLPSLTRLGSSRGVAEPEHAVSRLVCIVLNACCSKEIGLALVRAMPRVAVVCWSSLTEDSAARAFLVGFLTRIAELHEKPSVLPSVLPPPLLPSWAREPDGLELVKAAFAAGCASFSRGGFRFGDPTDYLHPAGHPHWARPQFATCPHCAPPVQGRVVLLHARPDGSIAEVIGADAMRSDGRSWKRKWRVITFGVRLAQRSAWSSANENVRDLHRECAAPTEPVALARQRSADAVQSTDVLYPEVGRASSLNKPGAFRRAHVLGRQGSGSRQASGASVGERSPPNVAHAMTPLAVG